MNRHKNWKHSHVFDEGNAYAERRTRWAVILTLVMMLAEIAGGYLFNSMALLADGWHMSTHALALGMALLAYMLARKFSADPRFTFGTWKMEVLAGYTSALLLVVVAALMFYESVVRLFDPVSIRYGQAIAVAAVGLLVNLLCAFWLKDRPSHDHAHGEHHHRDMNLRSAYIHVLTDAATSVLAIVALIAGLLWGAAWLDPAMGIVGAVLIMIWAYSLVRDTGKVLLDAEMQAPVVLEITQAVQSAPFDVDITDLHVWRVGRNKYACILGLATSDDVSPDYFRQLLAIHEELVHVTVEINRID
ncbi:CDF family Co(II)/Ni(II) efflux transporter DmeF [Oxalobacter sp. OttesenSCG-928-P03]|nr:CDF family Co(II)/Ni(II) efflux transporter DmeF [Oxalobacter sp. OttesenSCG-928-P03]